MLVPPIITKLEALKLPGMARGLREQLTQPDIAALCFEERLGLLVDREVNDRDNRRLKRHLQQARLRQNVSLEELDPHPNRGLDRALMASLATCQWAREHLGILITGPTGVGKTFLACALGQAACRQGITCLYHRLPRLLADLTLARADGTYNRQLATLARADVLVLDDFGLATLNDDKRRDLLELLEDRHARKSTIVTSQLPVECWHDALGDPTLADAILDRLVHNAYKIALTGESMRKLRSPLSGAFMPP